MRGEDVERSLMIEIIKIEIKKLILQIMEK